MNPASVRIPPTGWFCGCRPPWRWMNFQRSNRLLHASLATVACALLLLPSISVGQSGPSRTAGSDVLTTALEPPVINTRVAAGMVNTRIGAEEGFFGSTDAQSGMASAPPAAPASRFPARPMRPLPTLEGVGKAPMRARELPPPTELPKPSQPVIGGP
jgi:hypothetical protein